MFWLYCLFFIHHSHALIASNFMEATSTPPTRKRTRYEKDLWLQSSNRVNETHGIWEWLHLHMVVSMKFSASKFILFPSKQYPSQRMCTYYSGILFIMPLHLIEVDVWILNRFFSNKFVQENTVTCSSVMILHTLMQNSFNFSEISKFSENMQCYFLWMQQKNITVQHLQERAEVWVRRRIKVFLGITIILIAIMHIK